jgi:hypothetical protein
MKRDPSRRVDASQRWRRDEALAMSLDRSTRRRPRSASAEKIWRINWGLSWC